MSSWGRPFATFLNSQGESGSGLAQIVNFKEFARLNLLSEGAQADAGKGWYRISDFSEWHFVIGANYGESPAGSGVFRLVDTGSTAGEGHFQIPNLEE